MYWTLCDMRVEPIYDIKKKSYPHRPDFSSFYNMKN